MIRKVALAAGLWAAGTLLVLAAPAQAALIFFDNRADFELASGLSGITEDFEEANVGPGFGDFTLDPLNSGTDDGVFSLGGIADGLAILSSDDSGISVLGAGVELIDNVTFGNVVATQLPEPASLALFGLGLLGLGVAVRRRCYTYRLSPSGLTRGSIYQLARDG